MCEEHDRRLRRPWTSGPNPATLGGLEPLILRPEPQHPAPGTDLTYDPVAERESKSLLPGLKVM